MPTSHTPRSTLIEWSGTPSVSTRSKVYAYEAELLPRRPGRGPPGPPDATRSLPGIPAMSQPQCCATGGKAYMTC